MNKIYHFLSLLLLIILCLPLHSQNSLDDLDIILMHSFENNTIGSYDYDEWKEDWLNPEWSSRLSTCSIIKDTGDYLNTTKNLQINFPANSLGPDEGGVQWLSTLPDKYDEIYVSYDLMFMPGFQFQLGGKLPSVQGGTLNGGKPSGYDGFTGGLMFNSEGIVVFYIYYADSRLDNYGETFGWGANNYSADYFLPSSVKVDYGSGNVSYCTAGEWHNITYRMVLNTVKPDGGGNFDGILEAYFDGILVTQVSHLLFRNTTEIGIDCMRIYSFFGGNTDEWRNPIEEWLRVDNVILYTFKDNLNVPRGNVLSPTDRKINFWRKFTSEHTSFPNTPGPLKSISSTTSSVRIGWTDNSDNESGFLIYRSLSPTSGFSQIKSLQANTIEFTDSKLQSNTTYYYRIRAYNTLGYSNYSQTLSATTLPVLLPLSPISLSADSIAKRSLYLSWVDKSNNETGFSIERSTSDVKEFGEIKVLPPNTTEYSDIQLQPNTTYNYRLRSFNSAGYSGYSPTISAKTLPLELPAAPESLEINGLTDNALLLTWLDKSDNESGFRIERSDGTSNNFKQVAILKKNLTEYTDTALVPGMVYYYRIRAYNPDGNSSYSNIIAATTLSDNLLPGIPENIYVTINNKWSVSIYWQSKDTGKSGFELYRKGENDEDYQLLIITDNNTYHATDTTVGPESTYFYLIRAFNDYGYSLFSDTIEVTIPPLELPVAPTNLWCSDTGYTEVTLQWTDNSNNETGFKVECRDSNNYIFNEIRLDEPDLSLYTITGLQINQNYTFVVRSFNKDGYSDYSNYIFVRTNNITLPSSPTLIGTRDITPNSITVSWKDNSENESAFILIRALAKDSSYFESKMIEANDTSYTDIDLVPNTTYVYSVEAINPAGRSISTTKATASTLSFAETKRVKDGLIAYYNFNFDPDDIIHDISGNGEPLNLNIIEPQSISWNSFNKLQINSNTDIVSDTSAYKIIRAVKQTGEITLECWIKPSEPSITNVSRMLFLGIDDNELGFAINQEYSNLKDSKSFNYGILLQTESTTRNGYPELTLDRSIQYINLQHLVYVRDSSWKESIFVDGKLVAESIRPKDFGTWKDSYKLHIGNDVFSEHPWTGSFYLLAIYNKALSPEEVKINFEAKPCDDIEDKGTEYQINAYPNPSDNIVNFEIVPIELQDISSLVMIRIMDLYGNICYQQPVFNPDVPFLKSISFNNYPKGIYLFQLYTKDTSKTIKIIIR